jgi:predicted Zn finger-like uncharacterized protein
MIITCNNCNKKFDIESNLIPDNGRLLQCASCNHKWFFKKEITENTVSPFVKDIQTEDINVFDQNKSPNKVEINPSYLSKENVKIDTEELHEEKIEINIQKKPKKNIEDNTNERIPVKANPKKQKNFKILNIFILLIISLVAFIIIVDTFKYPIGKIVPNIEFLLNNLYESVIDISLFIRDLT